MENWESLVDIFGSFRMIAPVVRSIIFERPNNEFDRKRKESVAPLIKKLPTSYVPNR